VIGLVGAGMAVSLLAIKGRKEAEEGRIYRRKIPRGLGGRRALCRRE